MSENNNQTRALWLGLAAAAAAAAGAVAYAWWRAGQTPAYAPNRVRPEGYERVMVCLGDSLTHGRVSADYTAMLREKLGDDTLVVNAGVNGDLTWNALQRLDEVIRLQPDVVTVLLGTNDANAMLSEKKARDYIRSKNLPMWPTFHMFERNLRTIVQRLKAETDARILLFSPPVFGDEAPSDLTDHMRRYADTILAVAYEEGVTYLPLFEVQMKTLAAQGALRPPRDDVHFNGEVNMAVLQRYLLGRSWEAIGERQGYLLLTDGIHLNERGAGIIATLIDNALA